MIVVEAGGSEGANAGDRHVKIAAARPDKHKALILIAWNEIGLPLKMICFGR